MTAVMRVMDIVDAGPEGRLVAASRPVPVPGPGEVLVEVHAAGVNGADMKQVRGQYPKQEQAPSVPGLEVSGVIAALGAGVTQWHVGEAVCALVYGGGYAEFVAVPAVQCLRVPAGLDLVQAAALPEVAFTVWIAVMEQLRLQPGEHLLVHGGASGIGTMAIQMARVFGSFVVATGRGPDRVAACRAHGAEHAVDTSDGRFAEAVMAATRGRGVDAVLCMSGAPYLAQNLEVLRQKGRLCYVAFDGGKRLEVDITDFSLRNIVVTGVNLRFRSVEEKGRIAALLRERVWPMVERGHIRPVVGGVMPMAEAGEAHRLLGSGAVVGKMILTMR